MIENLFGSKTRYKLLKLFMSNPNQSFYVREITRKIDEQINSVRRELQNLLSIGVIKSDSSNNRLYYEVNQKFEKYQALVNLFSKGAGAAERAKSPAAEKDEGQAASDPASVDGQKLADKERALGNVSLVVLSGIFTRDKTTPADLLIVGNVTPSSLKTYVEDLESTIDGEVRYMIMDEEQFAYRRQIRDRSISLMLAGKLVVKVDKDGIV
ncbi:transcriptional regulator [Candidatus Saccharibacteria bacterium]|nr:transcriptional regulator [Candidatus Saccharibacteria bacterium]